MPRVGQNPLKWLPVDKKPQPITVTTIVYLPELTGFWAEGQEVLALFLKSLKQNTGLPFDLMVFDNGSCPEVRDYLLQSKQNGDIQFLVLSEYNLRKLGALNFLLASAPGEIISYADSDVYFRPGWLEKTLEILAAFPEAGQVSALPTVDKTRDCCESTYKAIVGDASLKVETAPDLIHEKFIEAHRISIGKTKAQYQKTVGERQDTRISRNGISAYVSAQDFQFTTRREVVSKVLPLEIKKPEEYYDPIHSPVFETRINELGYWRLSTPDYLIHHIGNTMPLTHQGDEWMFAESEPMKVEPQSEMDANKFSGFKQKLLHNQYSRRLLKRVNALTYSLLYEK